VNIIGNVKACGFGLVAAVGDNRLVQYRGGLYGDCCSGLVVVVKVTFRLLHLGKSAGICHSTASVQCKSSIVAEVEIYIFIENNFF
jgi:hypothetical protein